MRSSTVSAALSLLGSTTALFENLSIPCKIAPGSEFDITLVTDGTQDTVRDVRPTFWVAPDEQGEYLGTPLEIPVDTSHNITTTATLPLRFTKGHGHILYSSISWRDGIDNKTLLAVYTTPFTISDKTSDNICFSQHKLGFDGFATRSLPSIPLIPKRSDRLHGSRSLRELRSSPLMDPHHTIPLDATELALLNKAVQTTQLRLSQLSIDILNNNPKLAEFTMGDIWSALFTVGFFADQGGVAACPRSEDERGSMLSQDEVLQSIQTTQQNLNDIALVAMTANSTAAHMYMCAIDAGAGQADEYVFRVLDHSAHERGNAVVPRDSSTSFDLDKTDLEALNKIIRAADSDLSNFIDSLVDFDDPSANEYWENVGHDFEKIRDLVVDELSNCSISGTAYSCADLSHAEAFRNVENARKSLKKLSLAATSHDRSAVDTDWCAIGKHFCEDGSYLFDKGPNRRESVVRSAGSYLDDTTLKILNGKIQSAESHLTNLSSSLQTHDQTGAQIHWQDFSNQLSDINIFALPDTSLSCPSHPGHGQPGPVTIDSALLSIQKAQESLRIVSQAATNGDRRSVKNNLCSIETDRMAVSQLILTKRAATTQTTITIIPATTTKPTPINKATTITKPTAITKPLNTTNSTNSLPALNITQRALLNWTITAATAELNILILAARAGNPRQSKYVTEAAWTEFWLYAAQMRSLLLTEEKYGELWCPEVAVVVPKSAYLLTVLERVGADLKLLTIDEEGKEREVVEGVLCEVRALAAMSYGGLEKRGKAPPNNAQKNDFGCHGPWANLFLWC